VIGAGASAATTVTAWRSSPPKRRDQRGVGDAREPGGALSRACERPARGASRALQRRRALAQSADPAVTAIGGAVVEGFEFNSATHRYRVALLVGEQTRVEEVDQVIVNTGFGPDNAALPRAPGARVLRLARPHEAGNSVAGVWGC